MSDPRARITWLHVSDLHVTKDALTRPTARRPGSALWADVQRTFFSDLDAQLDATGLRPDLVLLTGDLVYSGSAKQYQDFDAELLGPLLAHLRARGCEAVPFAVPGNHDLQRPAGPAKLAYRCLRDYDLPDDHDEDLRYLRAQLWSARDATFLAPLFANYQEWSERSMLPALAPRTLPSGLRIEALHRSHVPGDLSLVVARDGLRLLLVGLNSSWIQFDGRDFKGKLHLPIEQLHAALASDEHAALRRFDEADAALLLMHHPREWLSPAAVRTFDGYVYPARDERFTACLFGHMHEARSEMSAGNGSALRYFYQSPSLFGLEHYGETQERLDVGYTLGALYEDREIRLWVRRMGRSGRFDVDPELHREPDGALLLRSASRARAPHASTPTLDPHAQSYAHRSDRAALGAWLLSRHDKLELLAPTGTFSYPFEEVYIPLAIALQNAWLAPSGEEDPDRDLAPGGGRDIELPEIFARALQDREVMIFGNPGAGKTTTLEKICHQMLLEGGEAVGLPRETLPILLPLRQVTHEDLAQDDPLLHLARRETSRGLDPLAPGVLERLWAEGGLLLLLDGLDEIADLELRDALVQHVVRGAPARRRQRIRQLVSSRYSGVTRSIHAVIDSSFLRLDVRPLERERIEALVHRWFRAAKHWQTAPRTTEERAQAEADAHAHASGVLADLRRIEQEDFEFKNLVATPLLLTLLCAVALANGQIPHKRPEFYQRCLEVLLRRYTNKTGLPAPISESEALRMLQGVAHGLHQARRRDGLDARSFARWATRAGERSGRVELRLAEATALLHWLHQHAGVLTRFGDDDYGFAHLTFQEYLTAWHIAHGGDEPVRALADRFGDPWWQEVTLLSLALPPHRTFEVLMDRVLEGDRWLADAVADEDAPEAQRESRPPMQLLRECWEDADERTVGPFLRVLRRPRGADGWLGWVRKLFGRPVDAATIDRQRIEVMRLLLGEADAELVSLAEALRDDGRESEGVRAVASELVARARRGLPRDATLDASSRAPEPIAVPIAAPIAAPGGSMAMPAAEAPMEEARRPDLDVYDHDDVAQSTMTAAPIVEHVSLDDDDDMAGFETEDLEPTTVTVPLAKPKPAHAPATARAAPTAAPPPAPQLRAGSVPSPARPEVHRSSRSPAPAPVIEIIEVERMVFGGGGFGTHRERARDQDTDRLEPLAGLHSPPDWVEPLTGIRLLWVPAGTFMMGSTDDDPDAHANERPRHEVRLRGFWLAETPVTNAQYGKYLRANEHAREPRQWRDRFFSGKDRPVVSTAWLDARAFCEWLSRTSGRSFALPTEAQWERAAKGPDDRRHPWGNEPPDDTRACFFQNHRNGRPAPVGQYPRGRGSFGHLDLAGNVWEWCQDAWLESAYSLVAVESKTDPVIEGGDRSRRVCRGGAWNSPPTPCLRTAYRGHAEREQIALGFRVCCNPPRT